MLQPRTGIWLKSVNKTVRCQKSLYVVFVIQNAELGGVPHYEHDENLFLEKREQMSYNVEDRNRVDNKYKLPSRSQQLRPHFHHHTSKYQSSLMFRKDNADKE